MQQLRPVHGERGDHNSPAALRRAVDHVRELVRHRAGSMVAVAIRRFAQQKIRARGRFRVFQDRLIVAAHVAGKHDQRLLPVFRDRQLQPRCAQDVPRIMRANRKLRADRERIVARDFAGIASSAVCASATV